MSFPHTHYYNYMPLLKSLIEHSTKHTASFPFIPSDTLLQYITALLEQHAI